MFFEMLKKIEDEREELFKQAVAQCEDFWVYRRDMNRMHSLESRSMITPKARLINGSLSISWRVHTFFNKKTGHWNSKTISKPRDQYRYKTSVLKPKCRAWEYETVLRTEDEFERLRIRSAVLSRVSRQVHFAIEAYKKTSLDADSEKTASNTEKAQ